MSSNILTMASLYTEITRLLDGEDPTGSDLSVASLSRLVVVAQRRIYGDVRSRHNEKAFTVTETTNNLAPMPADFVDLSIAHFGRYVLLPVDENVIRDYWSSNGSRELLIARAGNSFTFWPPVADGTSLQGRYYAELADLTDANIATNPLFQAADDLFVYASLVESAPFFGARQDMPVWEAKYASIVDRLNRKTANSAYSMGRLMMRPSARLCGREASGGWTSGSGGADGFLLTEDGDFLVAD